MNQLEVETRKCVCPLWIRQRKEPEAIGSATLLKIGDEAFALTAAHVVEEFHGEPIRLGTKTGFQELVGKVNVSVPPDTTDTAFIRVHPEVAQWLAKEYRFLSMNAVDAFDAPDSVSFYEFFGVPWRKARRSPNSREFRFEVYSFAGMTVPPHRYNALGISPCSHVAVNFVADKMMDAAGLQMTAPNPEGMSGGPVFRTRSTDITSRANADRRLVALAVEHRRGVLIGVRIGLVLEPIRRAYPRLRVLIPPLPPWIKLTDLNAQSRRLDK